MLGGTCTLIGTSTNLVVSEAAQSHGLAGFGMFEFTSVGLVLLAAGTAYQLLIGRQLIPERVQAESLTQGFALDRYISEVVVLPDSPLVGKTVSGAELGERFELDVLAHVRDNVARGMPDGHGSLEAGDVLRVSAPAAALVRLPPASGLVVKPGRHPDVAELKAADSVLLEAVITPASDLEGRTLKSVDFRNRFGATAIAIRRHGLELRAKIGKLPLAVGDELLILAHRNRLESLSQQSSFVILEELELPVLRPLHAVTACSIFAGVVVAATLDVLPIAGAAVLGAVLMVVAGALPLRRVYRSIDWQVLFMLAGLIPLGMAMHSTGAAELAVTKVVGLASGLGPAAVLSAFFLVAAFLTGFMSNAATAALLAPLAIGCGHALDVDPRPFLVALAFAASAAFWTPVGYQTNLLVHGPGNYRFIDFVKVGGPLTLISWIVCSLLIPILFPF
jgi:di/tricarboxylate transporter